MLIGAMSADIEKMRSRNNSIESRWEFVDKLKNILEAKFDGYDTSVIASRSNLNFNKLNLNFRILQFDITPFLAHKNRINRELVGWRHAVAHGNSPNLGELDAIKHIEFTADMLILLSQQFQGAIVAKAE